MLRKVPPPPAAPPPAEDPTAPLVSRARITKDGGGVYVSLSTPTQQIFDELIQFIAKREHYKASDVVEKYQRSATVVDAILKLSYLVEYCRRMDKKRLYIAGKDPDSSVVLALDELTRTSKYCFADGCNNRNSIVFCSLCNICCWCSEGCFAKSFETHSTTVCTMAQRHRKELGL